ncbi:unnamed protein product, partial [Ectocarpus sp. 12 AP-2014]
DTTFSSRSRLVLVWQSTTEADFYGTEEIIAMQVRHLFMAQRLSHNHGTTRVLIVTGCYAIAIPRMLSLPCAATVARSNLGSSGSGKPPPYATPSRVGRGDQQQPPSYRTPGRDEKKQTASAAGVKKERTPNGVSKLLPKKRSFSWVDWSARLPCSTLPSPRPPAFCHCQACQMGGGLVQGSVNREILNTAFGEALITSIAAYNNQRAVNSLLRSDSDGEDEKEGQDVGDGGLVGTDRTAGKLQVTAMKVVGSWPV